jgi:hypothetical protein
MVSSHRALSSLPRPIVVASHDISSTADRGGFTRQNRIDRNLIRTHTQSPGATVVRPGIRLIATKDPQMQLRRLATGAAAALGLALVIGATSLSAQSPTLPGAKAVRVAPEKSVAAVSTFATLNGVKAAPMASKELEAVKGLHVHFLDAGGGELHLAGDIKTENNWQNLGGIDPAPVAPSYHGLCVASGYSGPSAGAIQIPGGQFQCPL